jgi:hypothetical protein
MDEKILKEFMEQLVFIGKQLERLANICEREVQVKKVKERR